MKKKKYVYGLEEKQQTRHSVTVKIAGAAPVRTAISIFFADFFNAFARKSLNVSKSSLYAVILQLGEEPASSRLVVGSSPAHRSKVQV